MDLALVNTGRKSVAVLMNETTQGRGFVQRYDIVLGGGPFEVVAADVNNDSVADLIVANADLNTIDVVLGRTAGGFETPQHIAAAGFPRGVAVADLDWDGRPDIVYTQFDLDRVQILHGDGTGQFTARVAAMPTGPRPQGVAIGEFVGCCRPDIAVSSTTTRVLSFFRQADPVTFQRSDVATPSGLNVLATGDFNRDGRMDIAGVSTVSNNLVLLRDMGSGWGYYGVFGTGASPRGIEAVDLNRDGRLDLVAANRNANTLSVYIARADNPGWFVAPVTYAAGNGSQRRGRRRFQPGWPRRSGDRQRVWRFGERAHECRRSTPGPFWEASAAGRRQLLQRVRRSRRLQRQQRAGRPSLERRGARRRHAGAAEQWQPDSPVASWPAVPATSTPTAASTRSMIAMYHDGTYPQPITAELYYGNGDGSFQFAGAFGSFGIRL